MSMNTVPQDEEQLRATVREHYTQSILSVLNPEQSSTGCCGTSTSSADSCSGTSCCGSSDDKSMAKDLYSSVELGTLPIAAALASRGCGNPTALAELKLGEKVLDLGSGGGIDVLLSARRVGPTGFAYGLDMTDAMLELAERNRAEAQVENVRFLQGIIEAIPLPPESVDVVISNCVINLAADKERVLREAYRVLTPGGRFAVSDIVFQGHFPPVLRADLESWAGCIAGALEEDVYRKFLAAAGFIDIEVEVTQRFSLQDVAEGGASASIDALSDTERAEVEGKFVSAFVRARKPV